MNLPFQYEPESEFEPGRKQRPGYKQKPGYRSEIAGLAERCINVLYPRRCPVCGEIVEQKGELICKKCVPLLLPVREPVCSKCGAELISDREEYCADCLRHRKSFETGRALFQYNDAARKSVAAIKYKNKREYLDFYAEVMAWRYKDTVTRWCPDVLIPVPVHPSRFRTRGFNQAAELARRLGRKWNLPVRENLLLRVKRTEAQKELTPQERFTNLKGAFAVQGFGKACCSMPEKVLLIDDIYTTGSTIEACTRVLKNAGVRKVYFLTICIGYVR